MSGVWISWDSEEEDRGASKCMAALSRALRIMKETIHRRGIAANECMIFLPGLTSTRKENIPSFIADLRRSNERRIALFPTCLSKVERQELYSELESIQGLTIPHVHLRSDCDFHEIDYLVSTFHTVVFNIHPRASSHPFMGRLGEFADRVFVENIEQCVADDEMSGAGDTTALGGMCPDFAHLENARLQGREAYYRTTMSQLERFPIGCCHVSAIRIGVPNAWSGEWDHHSFEALADFDYLAEYRAFMPKSWASLELENPLGEQLEARAYIEGLIGNEGR